MLVVNRRDRWMLESNREALEHLSGERRLEIVSGSRIGPQKTEGSVEQVARLSYDWFRRHLPPDSPGDLQKPPAAAPV